MAVRIPTFSVLVLLAIGTFTACSAPKSNTLPDYAATRVKVNTGSAQSASLEARTAAVEIKNARGDIDSISARLTELRAQVEASRMRLAK